MKDDLKRLYSKVIKAHNEAPFHFEKRMDAGSMIKAYNPVCGDRFEIYVKVDGGKIRELYFHGFGCAISKASASVLAMSLEGKSIQEALENCDRFLRFLNKESKHEETDLSEDILAFAGVHDFPERYDCASLVWREMKKFLESR